MKWSLGLVGFGALMGVSDAAGPDLVFKLTVRSFLPGNCQSTITGTSNICPNYFSDIKAGTISGHPDFQTSNCCVLTTGLVNPDVVVASSGLYKPELCLKEDGTSCSTPGYIQSLESFSSWYDDNSKYNKRVGTTLSLAETACVGDTCTYRYDSNDDTDDFFGPLDFLLPGHQQSSPPPADFRDAEIWPQTTSEFNLLGGRHKYWFTTEIHSFFTFRGNSDIFSFSGDDDVWLFINGKLAVDIGGVHPREVASVNVGQKRVELGNLEVGKTYSFDLFHAERRQSQSNALITTSLTAGCNVRDSGTVEFKQSLANDVDFKFGPESRFNNNNKKLILTEASSNPFSSTFAYVKRQQNAGAGFQVKFTFTATGENEGFAFIMHRRPDGLKNIPHSVGENLGYKFLTDSVVIPFDFCTNRGSGQPCSGGQVSVQYPDERGAFNGPDVANRKVWDQLALFRGKTTHVVEIEYFQDPDWLEVTIDNSLYLRKQDFNLIDLLGGRDAWFGFSSATGATPGRIEITNFEVKTVEVDISNTVNVPLEEPGSAKADGVTGAEGARVQTRDACSNLITYGGLADKFKGFFVELLQPNATTYFNESFTPAVIPAEPVDNDDGTYSLELKTLIPSGFSLTACFGDCDLEVSFEEAPTNTRRRLAGAETLQVAKVELAATSAPGTLLVEVPNATQMLELTPSPTFAPTSFDPPEENNDKAVVIASASGGAALFFLVTMSAIMVIYRRKWRKDKSFIEDGRAHRLDRDITYDRDDEYSSIGRVLLKTRAAILKERAATVKAPQDLAINQLYQENEELQEQLRLEKKKNQLQADSNASSAPVVPSRPTKKTFSIRTFSMRMSKNPLHDPNQ